MSVTLQPSGLKTLDYGQEDWAAVMNSNLNIISNFIVRVQNLKNTVEPLPLDVDYNDPDMDGMLLVYDKALGKWKPFKGFTGRFQAGANCHEEYVSGVKIRTVST